MLKLSYHGGKCCGMFNIHGFGGDPANAWRDKIDGFNREAETQKFKELIDAYDNKKVHFENSGYNCEVKNARWRVLEAVLITPQMTKWRLKLLKDAHFHLVASFVNGNTTRKCYIFHRYVNSDTGIGLFEYKLTPNHKYWDSLPAPVQVERPSAPAPAPWAESLAAEEPQTIPFMTLLAQSRVAAL